MYLLAKRPFLYTKHSISKRFILFFVIILGALEHLNRRRVGNDDSLVLDH
jgi:hypothetical protein